MYIHVTYPHHIIHIVHTYIAGYIYTNRTHMTWVVHPKVRCRIPARCNTAVRGAEVLSLAEGNKRRTKRCIIWYNNHHIAII